MMNLINSEDLTQLRSILQDLQQVEKLIMHKGLHLTTTFPMLMSRN
jgi:hypothetical protein